MCQYTSILCRELFKILNHSFTNTSDEHNFNKRSRIDLSKPMASLLKISRYKASNILIKSKFILNN